MYGVLLLSKTVSVSTARRASPSCSRHPQYSRFKDVVNMGFLFLSVYSTTYEKSYDVCFPLFAKSKNTDIQRLWTARLLALDILQVLRNPVGTVHGVSASLRLP
jgi:hypothetical protein